MNRFQLRFVRFTLVGFMGAILQLTLMFLLMRWFSRAATPMAVEITILHNFFLHARFTWVDRGPKGSRRLVSRLWRFHAGNGLISLAGNTVLVFGLVEDFHVPALPAAMGAIALCSLVNFLVADRWVYRR
jgi:putative flippase GtrA